MDVRQYLTSPVVNGGGGAAGRIAIWSSATDLTGDALLTYDTATDSLTAGDSTSATSVHNFNGRSLTLTYGVSGGTALATIYNTSNTAGSAANLNIVVQGATAADPTIQWTVFGATDWIMGIDNSDGDNWKLSYGSVLGTNDTLTFDNGGKMTVSRVGGTQLHDIYGRGLNVMYATAGVTSYVQAQHTSNTAGSGVCYYLQVAGASAGDPFITFDVSSITQWSVGCDNSNSDVFSVSKSSTLGTSEYLRISTAGDSTFYGTVTIENGSGPHLTIKDGGTIGTNADPYLQFNDTAGLVGALGFLTSNSKNLSLANYTDTGSLFLSAGSAVGITIENSRRVTIGGTGETEIHRFNTDTAVTAGAAGVFWRVNINGTNYKVQLYADS